MGHSLKKEKKIEEALRLLDEASIEARDEISQLVHDRYKNLEESVANIEPMIRRKLKDVSRQTNEAIESGKEKVTESAEEINQSVKDHPWAYIGGTAVAGFIAGYFLGRK